MFDPAARLPQLHDERNGEGEREGETAYWRELAGMTHPAKITDPVKRRAAVEQATSGLGVGVRITRSLYRLR